MDAGQPLCRICFGRGSYNLAEVKFITGPVIFRLLTHISEPCRVAPVVGL